MTEPVLTWQFLLQIHINSDLSELKKFSEEAEGFLDSRLKAHESRSDELVAAQQTGEGKKIQRMFLTGGFQRYGYDFPHTLRYSLFVYLFSRWEHALDWVCVRVHQERKLVLKQKDLNGDVFERSKVYLEKVASFSFPKTPKTIQYVRVLGSIRNLIVHSNGQISNSYDKGKRKAIIDYLKKTKTGAIENDSYIRLGRTFCPVAAGVFQTFWAELFSALK